MITRKLLSLSHLISPIKIHDAQPDCARASQLNERRTEMSFYLKRTLIAFVAICLVVCLTIVNSAAVNAATAPAATAAPAAGSPHSFFNFCNKTGGKTIACFTAELTFTGRYYYSLRNIKLSDTLCDNRSVRANFYDQVGPFDTVSDTKGCHTSTFIKELDYFDSRGAHYIYIKLFAYNRTGQSDAAYSLKHYNPYY
jgi:hypothetical protein